MPIVESARTLYLKAKQDYEKVLTDGIMKRLPILEELFKKNKGSENNFYIIVRKDGSENEYVIMTTIEYRLDEGYIIYDIVDCGLPYNHRECDINSLKEFEPQELEYVIRSLDIEIKSLTNNK